MREKVEILFATLVASQKIEKRVSESPEDVLDMQKGLSSLLDKWDTIYDELDDVTKSRIDLMNLDGEANTRDLMHSFDLLKGELPEFIDEDVICKALEDDGHDVDEFKKGRLNIANLTPVKRQITTRDGRVYTKTVYVKKEEMSTTTHRGRQFLAQHELEKTLQVGDKVRTRFKGWSSGTEYTTDAAQVSKIESDKITLTFTKEFRTPGGHVYGPSARDNRSRQIVIPKTTSHDWNEKTSIEKVPEPIQTGPVAITSIDQISVGDKVTTKIGGTMQEVTVKYIHPNGDFIKVRTGGRPPKDLRRTLNKLMKPGGAEVPFEGLNAEMVDRIKQAGAVINVRGTSERGASQDVERIDKFNKAFKGFNLEEWLTETKEVIKRDLGQSAHDNASIDINLQRDAGFEINVLHGGTGFKMTRSFYPNSSGTGPKYVEHDFFTVDDRYQGKALGKDLFKALYKQYKAAKIPLIQVHANLSVGGYCWGRYGFTCSKSTAERLAQHFRTGASNPRVPGFAVRARDTVSAREAVRDFYREKPANTPFPVNILCTLGPSHKAGKAALISSDWQGKLDLTDTKQRTHFENYIGFSD